MYANISNSQTLLLCMYFCLFTVPSPIVEVTSIDTVEYGKATSLECNVITVRGITSRVDIIWMTGYFTVVKRVDNVTASTINNSAVYTDQLVTLPLIVKDSGREYYCMVNITATFVATSSDVIVLSFAGKL